MQLGSAKPAVASWGPTLMGLVRVSSADAPLSELRNALLLEATATGLTDEMVLLSQSSREAHLDDYLSVCCLDAGCEERRRMDDLGSSTSVRPPMQNEHSLSRHDRCGHAGAV